MQLVAGRSVGGWVGWGSGLDTADTSTIFDSDLDVSCVSPGCAPRVLDEVVLGTVLDTVSDGEDTVVKVGSALGSGDDTGVVHLEDELVGLDGDGDWLLVEGGLELLWGVDGDISVGGNLEGGALSLGGIAGSLSSASGGVWVGGLGGDGVGLGPLEGLVHKTSVASEILGGTVVALDEVLLGEGFELASGDEVSTFEATSGGEGPARSAAALVLDIGDGSFLNPVDSIGVGWLKKDWSVLSGAELGLVSVDGMTLGVGPVRHVVVLESPGELLVVVELVVSVDLSPLVEAEGVLFDGVIHLSVLGDVGHEVVVIGAHDFSGGSKSGESGESESFHLSYKKIITNGLI